MRDMRRLGRFGLGSALTCLLAWTMGSAGCDLNTAEDCDLNPILECGKWTPRAEGGGGSGAGGAATSGGGDGGGGGMQGNCDPESGSVDAGCGVFASVSLGAAGAMGTKTAPLASLADAVAAAGELKRVYACAEVFAEAVTVSAGITIYGGLDCEGGTWSALADTKTTVQGPADTIALRVENTADGAKLYDLAVRAADATVPGGSSIAVLVDGATVEMARCELTAGDGAKGADGVDGPSVGPVQPAKGANGVAACSDSDGMGGFDSVNDGGMSTNNDWGGAISIGGGGGDGGPLGGGNGSDGQPVGAAGQGGKGQSAGAWSCAVGGTNGGANVGDNGGAVQPGALAPPEPGTLDSTATPGRAATPERRALLAKEAVAEVAQSRLRQQVRLSGAQARWGAGGAGGCGGLQGRRRRARRREPRARVDQRQCDVMTDCAL
jgi:hypothetical protein